MYTGQDKCQMYVKEMEKGQWKLRLFFLTKRDNCSNTFYGDSSYEATPSHQLAEMTNKINVVKMEHSC